MQQDPPPLKEEEGKKRNLTCDVGSNDTPIPFTYG